MTKLSDKFQNVPIDEDTRILTRQECRLGDYDVLFEKWSWDGIRATTLVFCEADVAHLDNPELEAFVRASLIVNEGSQLTIKRNKNGFTFVNFNFEA